MRIAFYAPLKPPSHEVPSGDRRMARLLMTALRGAGHEVAVASGFRSFQREADPDHQDKLAAAGESEAERLIARYAALDEDRRPHAWFTYHLYYKAPDWLGPRVADALAIPYIVAEPSNAPKRARGPWRIGHRAAAQAISRADAVICLTYHDMECVAPIVEPADKLSYLPPFLDAGPFAAAARHREASRRELAAELELDAAAPWLLAVAMMRPGDKLASYVELAAALAELGSREWRLLVIGEGEAREAVEAAFAGLGESRVRFAGGRPAASLPPIYAASDLFVWPAVGEAYGMALLEAQAAGVPVVAGRERGVPDVVTEGTTGLLAPPHDPAALAALIARVLDDAALRGRLGEAAAAIVARERSVERAGALLEQALTRAGEGLAARTSS